MKFSTRDLCFCAIGAALIAVCAWISIPADVPFTLQTFAIFAVCGLLGGKRGTVSVLVYLLLGAVGAPVFAGFRGGFASLIGTTGGYLVGFILWRSSSPSRRRAGGSGSGCSCCRQPWGCSCATHSARRGFSSSTPARARSRSAWCWQSACCRFCCRTRSSSPWRRCCARGCTGASPHEHSRRPQAEKLPWQLPWELFVKRKEKGFEGMFEGSCGGRKRKRKTQITFSSFSLARSASDRPSISS